MRIVMAIMAICCLGLVRAGEKEYLWPDGKMPNAQAHQIAAPLTEVRAAGKSFCREAWKQPYLEWHEAPAPETRQGVCMLLISGGGYDVWCDVAMLEGWRKDLTARGVQCVSLVYRTPRPKGLPIYQTAWQDAQRAVRLVRAQAEKRGFRRVGAMSMSAGSHVNALLATSSLTAAYEPIDGLDQTSCALDFSIAFSMAYGVSDGLSGPNARQGQAVDAQLDSCFKVDAQTCPMCFLHGGADPYSPLSSTLLYRRLRAKHIPAEVHLFPDKGHMELGYPRAIEFMTQMGYLGALAPQEELLQRYGTDVARASYERLNLWPQGKMPNAQAEQLIPYLEWHTPKKLKTKAVLIVFSGGCYERNDPNGFEVAPIRRYLNEKGMTVVTLAYRSPRPSKASGLAKHTTAWQDLQRAVRLVRAQATERGLEPTRIGVMGSSAGGHLALLGAVSSLSPAALPVDELDRSFSCEANFAVAVYPAYLLTDGVNGENKNGGNQDADGLVDELVFDMKTCPTLFLHGDADGYSAMGSVKCWEKMRRIGVQSEVHTLALQQHCFQRVAAPGSGAYSWMDRVWEFLQAKKFL